jgi:hypothetical protein
MLYPYTIFATIVSDQFTVPELEALASKAAFPVVVDEAKIFPASSNIPVQHGISVYAEIMAPSHGDAMAGVETGLVATGLDESVKTSVEAQGWKCHDEDQQARDEAENEAFIQELRDSLPEDGSIQLF